MSEVSDPLVEAIAVAIEGVLLRGVRIQPEGGGWLIQLASSPESSSEDAPSAKISRSW